MKRIQFNVDVVEVSAPDMATSSDSRLLDGLDETSSIPSLPGRPKKAHGRATSTTSRARTLIETSALNASLERRESQSSTGLVSSPSQVRKAASRGSALRVVTGFRGAVIPEYRGDMPRVGHVGFVYQRNFYVFGGINAKGQYSSYLFCHEKRSLQWEEVRSVGLIPSGRANLSAIQYDNRLVIYGGNRQLDVLDDLYSYDLEGNRWEKIGYERSQGPGPVFLHTAVYVPVISSMVVLGGFHQREHNMYLGHAFDLRNRIWSGLPGPRTIDPQHIQLVTASYYDPKQSIVVLGLVERDIRQLQSMPPPSVYFMNVHSWVWTKVNTAASPESPIPFHMDVVWDYFTRQLVTMGGFYEEVQHTWFFPLNLTSLEQSAPNQGSTTANRNITFTTGSEMRSNSGARAASLNSSTSPTPFGSSNAGGGRRKNRGQYGFFQLSMRDMTWSIVPISLPKRFGNSAKRSSAGSAGGPTVATRAMRRSIKDTTATITRAQKQVLGDLNLDGVGEFSPRAGSAGGVGGGRPPSGSSSSIGRRSIVAGVAASELTSSAPATSVEAQQQQAALFTVRGEPQFQRKYAYAAYRDPQTSNRRKPMQYMIMHGGLQSETSPYALLMFTPLITRVDTLSDQRTTSHGTRSAGSSTADLDDSTSFSAFMPDASHSFDTEYSMPFEDSSVDQAVALADRERRANEERQDCLLPVLPCARTPANETRFAMLYHTSNSMQSARALPYANTPAAVLERPEDIMHWSAAFYRDKRRWLAEKLKTAVTEDRRLRRGARRQFGSGSRSGAGGADEDATEGDEDDTDVHSPGSRPASGGDFRPRSTSSEAPRGSMSIASAFDRSTTHLPGGEHDSAQSGNTGGDGDATATAAALANLHKDDFFKAKGLEPFVMESAVLGGRNDTLGASLAEEAEDPFLAQTSDVPEVIPAGLERLWMKVKRHGEQQRLPAAVFRGAGTVNDGTMTGDLGSVMAFLLLRNAIAMLPADDTPEKRSRRAQLRWRFLRALVTTGEAAFIIYRANQRDARTKGQLVTGYPGLVMAPELLLVGATRAHKVPTRPVPYTVARPPPKKAQYAEVTKSGMVSYHNIHHVK